MTPAGSFAASFLLLFAAVPACAGKIPAPLALLQGLHTVQDSVAYGELDDPSIQGGLLEQLQASLQISAKPDGVTREWEQAAIGYALSGAPSKTALGLLDGVRHNSDLKPIAAAVSLYLKGNFQNAAEQFQAIKGTDIPANLAPLIVIAHANAVFETSPKKSKELFRLALNLAPGTLIEELSLRRLTQISIENGDKSEFLRASKLYWRRYHDSPFSEKYILEYSKGIAELIQDKAPQELIEISYFIDQKQLTHILNQVFTHFLLHGEIDLFRSSFSTISKTNIYSDINENLYVFYSLYTMSSSFSKYGKITTHQNDLKYNTFSIGLIYKLMSDVISQIIELPAPTPDQDDIYYENSKSDEVIDLSVLDKISMKIISVNEIINITKLELDSLK